MAVDEAMRVRLGANRDTTPALLEVLAEDQAVTVRAALALNPGASPHVNKLLSRDRDERVRVLLARKLGALAPSLTQRAHDELRERVMEMLAILVNDEAVRVRAAVADEIRHMPDAPRALILSLARDPSLMVCEPVIQFSPLLTTADLVALITAPTSPHTLTTVASRSGLPPEVSDAIAATTDADAIRALLANPSAHIREATLDALASRSVTHPEWHEPFVHRPVLSPGAARALSELVATHLLEALAARADLDPSLAHDLQRRLTARLSKPPTALREDQSRESAVIHALSLASKGKLTEAVVLRAARDGETALTAALLAVAAGVAISIVDHACALQNTKGLVSLTWKARFTMRLAVELQGLLTRLPPDSLLKPGANNSFPLSEEEMRWQIEFLSRPGR